MTPERFRAIVAAYGADARRWPATERAAARTWAAAHRVEADAMLAESAQLDAWLANDVLAPPGAVLVERIVAGAPARRWPWSRARLWWSGVAFAGVGLAGGLAGALAVSFFVVTGAPPGPYELHELSYQATGFGAASADWSGE
jgi:hypothetical protein